MSGFRYEKDSDGIVLVTMDLAGAVNTMGPEYRTAMAQTVARLEAENDLTGVVFASAKNSFFAGGDLQEILAVEAGAEAPLFERVESIKADLRRLERLPVPVVAAINGAALGGGYEICLACQYRVAWRDRRVQLGLPEVTLGLLPGGGGVVRLVTLLGLEQALPILLEGKSFGAEAALAAGLVDELVDDQTQLIAAAKRWLLAHRGDADAASQSWDRKGFRIPGGDFSNPAVAQLVAVAPARLIAQTRGLLPAPERILACAVEALRVDFDTALRAESRAFISLLTTPQAKNLITGFFQRNDVNSGASRPAGIETRPVKKVGVLGAGMMGQGIAYVAAKAGVEVVLKDISREAAERGKAYAQKQLDKDVARGRIDGASRDATLARITATADAELLAGCDLIIEAVFEDLALKRDLTQACEKYLDADGVWASNTSSLPIGMLAAASARPDHFIGMHFFSPVDRMPLVEIICGESTSEQTLARAYDFARQLRKTPIVVNDALGFFTSRTFGTYLDEGVRLLHEGQHPLRIEAAGRAVGMPVGPLALSDEVSQQLNRKIHDTWRELGVLDSFGEQVVWREVLATMIDEHGRGGRHHGGGFYQYEADGGKVIWPGLYELYYRPERAVPDADLRDRLLFRPVLESLKCLQDKVLRCVADGNVGSLLGIGAPAWTGGYLQFVNTYGVARFNARCGELAARYGERFEAPPIALEKAERGELFV